jgi:hypothetical protein
MTLREHTGRGRTGREVWRRRKGRVEAASLRCVRGGDGRRGRGDASGAHHRRLRRGGAPTGPAFLDLGVLRRRAGRGDPWLALRPGSARDLSPRFDIQRRAWPLQPGGRRRGWHHDPLGGLVVAFSRGRFRGALSRRCGFRREPGRLALRLRGSRALLHPRGARLRRVGRIRVEPVLAAAICGVPEPPSPVAALEPALREGRQKARLSPFSAPHRDQSGWLRRSHRMHLGRNLPGLRLSHPRQGDVALGLYPEGERERESRSAARRRSLRPARWRGRTGARCALPRRRRKRAGGARSPGGRGM